MISSSRYFIKNGIDCRKFGLMIVSLTDDNREKFGLVKNLKTERYSNFQLTTEETNNPPTINIMMAAIDKSGQPVKLEPNLRRKICNYLYTSGYSNVVFEESRDIEYIGTFIEGERTDFGNENGYISCKFKLAIPYGFTKPFVYSYSNLNGEIKQIQIKNVSNIEDVEPIITITNFTNEYQDIELCHKNRNTICTFKLIPPNSKVTIDNFKQTVSDNYDFSKFNRQWIKMNKGINFFEFKGKCMIDFKIQCAIAQ